MWQLLSALLSSIMWMKALLVSRLPASHAILLLLHQKCQVFYLTHYHLPTNGAVCGLTVCKTHCDLLIRQVWCIWVLTGRGFSTELKLGAGIPLPCALERGENPTPMAGLSYYFKES